MNHKMINGSLDFSDESSDEDILSLISNQKQYKRSSLINFQDKIEDTSEEKEILKKQEYSDSDDKLPLFKSSELKNKDNFSGVTSYSNQTSTTTSSIPKESSTLGKMSLPSIISIDDGLMPIQKESIDVLSDSDDDIQTVDISNTRTSVPTDNSDIIMYTKGILFTFQSPFINSRFDVTEYDRRRLYEGVMLNDSLVNFYLHYSLNQSIEDELLINEISRKEALDLIYERFTGSEERKAAIFRTMNKILLRTYIFSTFFFPLLKGLRKSDNLLIKQKVITWAYDSHLFEREFVLFPIFQHSHFSLAVFCYPNMFKSYIQQQRVVNGIDYSKTRKERLVEHSSARDKFPCLVYLDSLGNGGEQECSLIRYCTYILLREENIPVEDVTQYNLPQLRVRCAQQLNGVDCGVYTIAFAKKIIQKACVVQLVGDLSNQENVDKSFRVFDLEYVNSRPIRVQIRKAIDELTKEYQKSGNVDESDGSDLEVVKEYIKGKKTGEKKEKKRSERSTGEEEEKRRKSKKKKQVKTTDEENSVRDDPFTKPKEAPDLIATQIERDYQTSLDYLLNSIEMSDDSKLRPLMKETQQRKSMIITDIKRINGIDKRKL